ncbi:MAG: ABC transporter ATP-binding protein [Armatimonadota bacterium]
MSLLSIQRLTHAFAGLTAVDDFNLELQRGELVAVIGPNGAGKTTLFNLITGVYRPTQGCIAFDGVEIVGQPTHRIVQRGIARTFQNIRLFKDLSVLDNVRIAQYGQSSYGIVDSLLRLPRFTREEASLHQSAMDLLGVFGLADSAQTIAKNLPYGQQRRLEIARALATRPTLLLLDEPAAGMNPMEADELMRLILWMHQEFHLTILLIEHQMPVVMGTAQRISVLNFGKTIAEGTPEEIRAHPAVIEAYLGEETEE